MDVTIGPLQLDEVNEADRIFRLAFGTRDKLPDPSKFGGGVDIIRSRFMGHHTAALGARVAGELVGSSFAANWGGLGILGPLSVRPDVWDKGIAQTLLQHTMKVFDRWENNHVGLFTLAESTKHVGLYQKYGFWPRFLTAIMAKPVGSLGIGGEWTRYSQVPDGEKAGCLEACREVTASLYEGLDLSGEISSVATQNLGDTLLLWDGRRLLGFAVCHWGPRSEAGSGVCYIKFGAVTCGEKAGLSFERLLDACGALAVTQGMQRLAAGINTARQDAYGRMLAQGFRTLRQGVSMHRPGEAAYSRADVYAIDDWR